MCQAAYCRVCKSGSRPIPGQCTDPVRVREHLHQIQEQLREHSLLCKCLQENPIEPPTD